MAHIGAVRVPKSISGPCCEGLICLHHVGGGAKINIFSWLYGSFQQLGALFTNPPSKDHNILGSISGSPLFGNSHMYDLPRLRLCKLIVRAICLSSLLGDQCLGLLYFGFLLRLRFPKPENFYLCRPQGESRSLCCNLGPTSGKATSRWSKREWEEAQDPTCSYLFIERAF